jgi:hypothetical protein
MLVAMCVVAGVAVALAMRAAYGLVADDDTSKPFISLDVRLPSGWNEAALSADDRDASVIYRAERLGPDASMVVRATAGGLPEALDMEALAVDTEAALAAEVDGFDLITRRVELLASNDAVSMLYRHGQDQSRLVILTTPVRTYYVVLTAARVDFTAIENEATAIFESIAAEAD